MGEGVVRRSPAGVRRVPVQARSRRKVEAILDAARDLLLSGGMARLSVDALADRAGVAVGTIYQFFPGKEAVLNELAGQSLAKARVWLAELQGEPVAAREWSERLDLLVARMAEGWRNDAMIWDPAWTTPEMRQASDAFDGELATIVERILADAGVAMARRRTMATIIVESTASVLDRWARQGAPGQDVPAEIRTMLGSYIHAARPS